MPQQAMRAGRKEQAQRQRAGWTSSTRPVRNECSRALLHGRLSVGLLLAEALDLQARGNLRLRLLEHHLAVHFRHALVLLLSLAGPQLLLAGALGNALLLGVGLLPLGDSRGIELERVLGRVESDLLVAGKDLVPAVLLVPLRERGRHVHLLDDVPPADAGVVGAETDLAFLSGVRNDAALGAAEVVVEQV